MHEAFGPFVFISLNKKDTAGYDDPGNLVDRDMMQLTKANVAPVLSDNEGIDLNLEKCTLAIVSSTCGIAPVRS